jgi:hypothetical protein
MKITTAKTMFSAAALSLGFLALGSSSAYATTVDYYTEASINGSTMSGNPLVNGDLEGTLFDGISISFTGIGNSIFPATTNAPSQISLGDVDLTAFTSSGQPTETFTNVPFNLEIFQTVPTSGNGTLVGSVSGTFSVTQASIGSEVTFSNSVVTIGSTTYTLQYNPVELVSPSTNGGNTSIQADVVSSAAPEPMTTALVGAGLLGVSMLRRRKA